MLGHQQREVRVLRLLLIALVAVAIHCDDAIRVLIDHNAVRIHTKSTHVVLELLGAVHNLALIELIRQMGENNSRKLHTHADIHTVRFRGNLQLLTYLLHPLTAASSYGYDTLLTLI